MPLAEKLNKLHTPCNLQKLQKLFFFVSYIAILKRF